MMQPLIINLAPTGLAPTRDQSPHANGLGVVMGDGVRVGLEDNLWLDDACSQLATNEQLLKRVIAQANTLGRPIATAHSVRERLRFAR
jgi:uncharacterized protein (DUF849 family)